MATLKFPKPIPDSESDRVAESIELLKKITDADASRLTTWEVELIDSLSQGMACTRIRLKELRECVARIEEERGNQT